MATENNLEMATLISPNIVSLPVHQGFISIQCLGMTRIEGTDKWKMTKDGNAIPKNTWRCYSTKSRKGLEVL
jgi:hypothetical protein